MWRLILACMCGCTGAPPRAPAPPPEPRVVVDAPVAIDAAPVAIDAAPVPIDAAAGTAVCSTHYNMLPDANVLVGMTEAEVQCSIGAPQAIAGATWTYRLPRDCSEIEDNVTIVFANGRVSRATSKRRHTGKFCQ